jgi:hypothetical protein
MNSLLIEILWIFTITSSATHIVFPCSRTLLTAAGFAMATTMFGFPKTGKEQRQVTLQSSHYTV